MASDKITKLGEYLDKNKAKNYPIPNSMLEQETDYLKNSYLKMLAVLLQQASAVEPSQEYLFTRMVEGVKADYSMQDYLRQALEIEVEEFEEFASQYRELDLRYRFLLDAILLCSVTEAEEGQLRLAASYIEFFGLEKEEANYLAEMAKCILKQDSIAYLDAERIRPEGIRSDWFQDYIKLFHIEGVLRVQPEEKQAINLKEFLHMPGSLVLRQKKIYMRNLELDLSEYTLELSGNEEVVFEDCEFHGGENPIILKEIQKIHFSKCMFQNFTNRVIVEETVSNAIFEECGFLNCFCKGIQEKYGDINLGVVVYVKDYSESDMNYFSKCNFTNCSSDIHSDYDDDEDCDGIICNVISKVNLCKFKDCNYYYLERSRGSWDNHGEDTIMIGLGGLFPSGTDDELNIMDCHEYTSFTP